MNEKEERTETEVVTRTIERHVRREHHFISHVFIKLHYITLYNNDLEVKWATLVVFALLAVFFIVALYSLMSVRSFRRPLPAAAAAPCPGCSGPLLPASLHLNPATSSPTPVSSAVSPTGSRFPASEIRPQELWSLVQEVNVHSRVFQTLNQFTSAGESLSSTAAVMNCSSGGGELADCTGSGYCLSLCKLQ